MDIEKAAFPHKPEGGVCDVSKIPTIPSCAAAINTDKMRQTRPWYCIPLLINLALLYSSKQLLTILETGSGEDIEFPVCDWLIFSAIALTSPLFLVMSRLLPEPSMALCIGGALSATGLFWAGFATPGGLEQKMAFGLFTGTGISLSMQATTLAISPYFLGEAVHPPGFIIYLSAMMMQAVYPLNNLLSNHFGNSSLFVYHGAIILVASCVPILVGFVYGCRDKLERRRKHLSTYTNRNKGSLQDVPILRDPDLCESNDSSYDLDKDEALLLDHNEGSSPSSIHQASPLFYRRQSCLQAMGHGLAVMMEDKSWKTSFLSVLVWLTWGAGVDTTWLNITWAQELSPYPHRLPVLQLIIALGLVVFKLAGQKWGSNSADVRVNLASNYMHLGLLGCSGFLLCVTPTEWTHSIHGSLLFTVTLALQYDDLSDLCLTSPSQTRKTSDSGIKEKELGSATMWSYSQFLKSSSSSLSWPQSQGPTTNHKEDKSNILPESLSHLTHNTSSFLPTSTSTQVSVPNCLTHDANSKHPVSSSAKDVSSISSPSMELSSYTLVKYNMMGEQLDTPSCLDVESSGAEIGEQSCCNKSFTVACLIGHCVSLLLMAMLSMVLGLQIANMLKGLFALPPFSYLCSSTGLLVLSLTAMFVSIGKPDAWIGGRRKFKVLS